MKAQLTNEDILKAIRSHGARTEARPSTEEFTEFKPLGEQWEKLNAIPEAQRTSWQKEAHAFLLSELTTRFDSPWFPWDRSKISEDAMAAAFELVTTKPNEE